MMVREAWRRWQAAAGPWQGWCVCPILAAPEPHEISADSSASAPERHAAASASARHIGDDLAQRLVDEQPTLVLLDLDVCIGVQVAAELFRRAVAHPVLVLPRWPYTRAVLPLQPLLQTLLDEAATLPPSGGRLRNVAFVLDADRGLPLPGRPADDPRADNRYRLAVGDLPTLATLRARGLARVLKLSRPCVR